MNRAWPILQFYWIKRAALVSDGGIHARPFWAASLRWNVRRRKRR